MLGQDSPVGLEPEALLSGVNAGRLQAIEILLHRRLSLGFRLIWPPKPTAASVIQISHGSLVEQVNPGGEGEQRCESRTDESLHCIECPDEFFDSLRCLFAASPPSQQDLQFRQAQLPSHGPKNP